MVRGCNSSDLPPRARRVKHTKSRTGCSACKQRHIKCDETQPSCFNCTQRSISCSYTQSTRRDLKRGPGRPRLSDSMRHISELKSDTKDIYDSAADSLCSTVSASSEHARPGFDIADFELIHHYYTSTCATFSADAPVQTMYRTSIPQMALSHSFLLRLLLALAGLHLRYLHSETGRNSEADRCAQLAEKHFAVAVPQLKLLLSDLKRDDCEIAHVSAILVCMHLLARGPTPGEYLVFSENDSAPLWMGLLKGVKRIRSVLGNSQFAQPVPRTETAPIPDIATAVSFGLPRVEWQVPLRDLECFIATHVDLEYKETYSAAVSALTQSFRATYGSGEDGSFEGDPLQKIVFRWLYLLDDRMIERLQQKDPHALIVFGHYAILLRVPELGGYWFSKGWSCHILRGIYTILQEPYRDWLKWPFAVTGLEWDMLRS